jgi:hypothetical protein
MSMNVAGFVSMTDEEVIVRAMRDAQLLLAHHIERGPLDPEEAITRLLEVLDRQDVVAATDRLCGEYGLRTWNKTGSGSCQPIEAFAGYAQSGHGKRRRRN